ncbi:MAG: nitrous oxide reductase accessory protein NosL [Acidimicrobiia bacterium]|nr:nitrous oxide reductase accessory protein NosL [Acidimicrobiia bacterium]
MTRLPGLLLVLALAAASACGGDSAGPPEINYGRDTCDGCDMVIDDPRFASAYRLPDGTESRFDDMGEMFTRDELGDADAWVHDYDTEGWVEATSAWYVAGTGVESPMATGVVAFSTESRARAFASESGGTVLTWDEMLTGGAPGSSDPEHPGAADHGTSTSPGSGRAD